MPSDADPVASPSLASIHPSVTIHHPFACLHNSWKWGANEPSGTVEEVVEGHAEIETKNGNSVSRNGDEEDPAVKIKSDNGGTSVLKLAHELVGVEPGEGKDEGDDKEEEEDVSRSICTRFVKPSHGS